MDATRTIPIIVHGSPRMPEAPAVTDSGIPIATEPDGRFPDFVDVSHHQQNVNWGTYAASGRNMAICKATEGGDWVDRSMPDNRASMNQLGLYCGMYHFAGASGSNKINDPIKEATHFCDTIGPLGPKEFPVLDFELPYKMTPEQQVTWIGKWCTEVQNRTGKLPWVYTSSSMLGKMEASSLTKFPLWVANYNSSDPTKPPPSGSWPGLTAWQYTWRANVPGMPPVDDSYLYGDLPSLVAPVPAPPPADPPTPPS